MSVNSDDHKASCLGGLFLSPEKSKFYKDRWKKGETALDSKESLTIHAAQIPKAVSKKLINSCTEPGDTVLVLFGGSGSECEVCVEGGRKFITAELQKKYVNLIRARIRKGTIPEIYKLKIK